MNRDTDTLSKRNPHLDLKVVRDFERLASQSPLIEALKKGSDYGLSHPLDSSISFVRHKRTKDNKAAHTNR